VVRFFFLVHAESNMHQNSLLMRINARKEGQW